MNKKVKYRAKCFLIFEINSCCRKCINEIDTWEVVKGNEETITIFNGKENRTIRKKVFDEYFKEV